ncbi:aldehyde dehydrogenase family protein [Tropicimonas sp. S265A]|uniref:aldehyde dehydrogenase family protein n=1 Tax=Tropicimonas sp. S265A TaxID=3415134 RepID=UPI003C7AA33C
MTTHDLRLIGRDDPAPSDPVFEARHLIDGQWLSGTGTFTRESPAHGTRVTRAALGTEADAKAAIAAARAAFDDGRWSTLPGKERAAVLDRTAALIERDIDRIAQLETLESGKPITQAKAEIAGAADLWRYAAALARTSVGETQNALGPDMLGLTLREPIGVVSMITPWNFPFLIVSQKLPYALAAGCTAVVKPSELTSATTVILGELLIEAGLPAGVVNIVLGYGAPVGEVLSTDPRVDMVSFTGSTGVGRAIVAATAPTLKKVALELGGKNPQVVFADADLDAAADAIAFGVYFNAGECCNSGSRIIVHRNVIGPLTEKLVALSRKVAFGDPLHPDTQVGAIISDAHQAKIDRYVQDAVAGGATLALGGAALPVEGLPGRFYAPTLVNDVTPDMPIATQEVFGPVLSILTFDTFEEAMGLVNDTEYGLSAGVWSESVETCLRFARHAQAGTVWTNTWMDGFPELPFGGVKQSGLGRELGRQAIEDYQETKTVTMRIGTQTRAPWVAE